MDGLVTSAIRDGIVIPLASGRYSIVCFNCKKFRNLKTRENVRRNIKHNKFCNSCRRSLIQTGKKLSDKHKQSLSSARKEFYTDKSEIKKMSLLVKKAVHRPDVRKKHIEALYSSKWLKVKTDKGQLELLEKWNRLGFNFEPNYQIKIHDSLFYLDGYDKTNNVIIEYDSKYHIKLSQRLKDEIRQLKIINHLNPKAFWRYNKVANKIVKVK